MSCANIILVIEMSNNIRKYRKSKRMSQDTLAEMLHVHQTAVSQWENEKTEPDISNLARMAEIFEVTIDDIMGVSKKGSPDTQDVGARQEVIDIMTDLSSDEIQRVRDFVSGLKASRAK